MNLKKLEEKRQKLEKQVLKSESDLKKPLKKNLDANALGEENREKLKGVYKIEKKNLEKLNEKIQSNKLKLK